MQIKLGDIVEIWGKNHKIGLAVFPYFWDGQWHPSPKPMNPFRAGQDDFWWPKMSKMRFVRARYRVTEVGYDVNSYGTFPKIKGVAIQNLPDEVNLTPYIDDMRVVPPGEDFIDITPGDLRDT